RQHVQHPQRDPRHRQRRRRPHRLRREPPQLPRQQVQHHHRRRDDQPRRNRKQQRPPQKTHTVARPVRHQRDEKRRDADRQTIHDRQLPRQKRKPPRGQ